MGSDKEDCRKHRQSPGLPDVCRSKINRKPKRIHKPKKLSKA